MVVFQMKRNHKKWPKSMAREVGTKMTSAKPQPKGQNESKKDRGTGNMFKMTE